MQRILTFVSQQVTCWTDDEYSTVINPTIATAYVVMFQRLQRGECSPDVRIMYQYFIVVTVYTTRVDEE